MRLPAAKATPFPQYDSDSDYAVANGLIRDMPWSPVVILSDHRSSRHLLGPVTAEHVWPHPANRMDPAKPDQPSVGGILLSPQ